ncbi:MAG: hypothetical protein LAO78_19785, partial [Acidobacteriia bacterium]|nr:hypothetical protein [Terriglobia bacterium]
SPACTLATAACQNCSPRFLAPFKFATRSSFSALWGYYLCLTFRVQDTWAIMLQLAQGSALPLCVFLPLAGHWLARLLMRINYCNKTT